MLFTNKFNILFRMRNTMNITRLSCSGRKFRSFLTLRQEFLIIIEKLSLIYFNYSLNYRISFYVIFQRTAKYASKCSLFSCGEKFEERNKSGLFYIKNWNLSLIKKILFHGAIVLLQIWYAPDTDISGKIISRISV